MHWLETKIPPPVVMVLLGLAAFAITRLVPAVSFSLPLRTPVAVVLGCVGVALNGVPKLAFKRAGTTVNPLRPALATQLITGGVYRYSRNPMYLGHAFILLGWTLYLHHAAALLAVALFVLYVTRFQIRPEERQLSVRFPGVYAEFCARVRRWL
ncbi:methyltransferase family protein [Xanthomonas oryzae]|uniref:Isoprenylcysteine carboxylmethyltransferase family protein n=2 Tax=Xanthomonas oryzae TaxID=347 RepID=A0AAJ6GUA8_9XANT|nr:isoprenylcysteine carboxylmethyltransferase family protein [Xanthomonas oryzae]WIX06959.1 isoprenylcysteine carboxylmethyltransferase family protein [Xanthomonas oryzae pv. oryzae]QBG93751.1 isoprenylcysteine carboxylmethyltransferase family protein [Xanthomonas oryzae]QBG97451.1 isoprenylcysteine carboxylmethyltransferase family protein [Xanthomonas oryzae]QBG98459.1 isoprenylcysteine carboxylmethyltransferase family protein [Xanthomonas oryzae]QBH02343.1 isoprenylcysteine carboxylmethyltr